MEAFADFKLILVYCVPEILSLSLGFGHTGCLRRVAQLILERVIFILNVYS
jgi:hypothetical protein